MRFTDITDSAADALRSASARLGDLTTPTLRIGVTGLSRAGKTVFVTALARCLTEGGAVPGLGLARLPAFRAYLEPQPDDDVPRFAYETHLAALAAEPPAWPESTRQISQLRITLAWEAQDWARRTAGITRRLHLDIVDYPGEWLVDLALMGQSFEVWSKEAIALALRPQLEPHARAFLAFLAKLDGGQPGDERLAIEGAAAYTAFIRAAREATKSAIGLGPGRFLMPGDLDGSPLLTFFPLAGAGHEKPARTRSAASLSAMLERRYESYKAKVVRPFFERHFQAIDRQIVLIDLLGALDRGGEAVGDLETAITGVLAAFRPGANHWLSFLTGKRCDRVLFAATKADHLNRRNHDRLAAILDQLVKRSAKRVAQGGARVGTAAIAGLAATEDVERTSGETLLACVRGRPAADEVVAGKRFDGRIATVLYPGDLPTDPLDAFEADVIKPGSLRFPRFAPPRIAPATGDASAGPWPNVGLAGALAFLIGDRLT